MPNTVRLLCLKTMRSTLKAYGDPRIRAAVEVEELLPGMWIFKATGATNVVVNTACGSVTYSLVAKDTISFWVPDSNITTSLEGLLVHGGTDDILVDRGIVTRGRAYRTTGDSGLVGRGAASARIGIV